MITKIPQVILLGNGINRAYGGTSWNEFLKAISDGKYKDMDKLRCPMPLKAILVTGDKIDEKLANYINAHREETYGIIRNERHAQALQSILSIGVDHILTTNYSYELEYVAQKALELSDSNIIKLQKHTDYVKQADKKYLLSTYNELKYDGVTNKIWHIHGEARKPNSIVLGHLYYVNLATRIKNIVDKNSKKYIQSTRNNTKIEIKSWVDAFIMGDVYILGARLDLSEIDLWWLINRKKREKARHGKLYFYEPIKESEKENEIDERLELIKIFADVNDMGIKIPKEKDNCSNELSEQNIKYQEFYVRAIKDIGKKIHNNNAINR